jgi:hypothetical protein
MKMIQKPPLLTMKSLLKDCLKNTGLTLFSQSAMDLGAKEIVF